MTCTELRKVVESSIGKGGPCGVSRAERVAVCRHLEGCPDCLLWFDGNVAEAERRAGLLLALLEAVADIEVKDLVEGDRKDGEA